MSITPERRRYAEMRIDRLSLKLSNLYMATKTPDVRAEIRSTQQAIRRWEGIIAQDRIVHHQYL